MLASRRIRWTKGEELSLDLSESSVEMLGRRHKEPRNANIVLNIASPIASKSSGPTLPSANPK